MKLAIHLHMYYANMWPYVRKYLENIGTYPYDLYITLVKENAALVKEIQAFHPATTVWQVENRGFDVGPFIYFLQHINLSDYDLVLKIHTKEISDQEVTELNHICLSDKMWTDSLFSALLGSEKTFLQNLKHFKEDSLLGMIGSKRTITSDKTHYKGLESQIIKEMNRLHLKMPNTITFVAGTMFLVRSTLLESFKKTYQQDMFLPSDGKVKDGTLAHVLERVFGLCIISKGYKIEGFDKYWELKRYHFLHQFLKLLYSNTITSRKYRLIKICKIPVWHKKIH